MRVLFFMRHTKWRVFNDIAKVIQKEIPEAVFGAHVIYHERNLKFLKEQKEVSYSHFYTTSDLFEKFEKTKLDYSYLRYFEETYDDLNGWLHLYADRDLLPHTHYRYGYRGYSHEELLRWIQAIAKHIEGVFDDFRPDVYIDFGRPSALRSIIRAVCRKRDIRCFVPLPTRYKNWYFWSATGEDRWEALEERYADPTKFSDFNRERGYQLLHEFRMEDIQPAYKEAQMPKLKKEANSFFTKKWFHKSTFQYFKKEKERCKNRTASYRENLKPYHKLVNDITRDIRKVMIDRAKFFRKDISPHDSYCYFALSIIPEANTAVDGSFFMNELFAIESLARSLPLHFKLYVKEHLPMLYLRPVSFYKSLKKIPNVVLLDPFLEGREVIKQSDCVATISGTAGLEGVFFGKPSLVMGKPWYRHLGLTYNESNVTRFPKFFKELDQFTPTEEQVALLLQDIEACGFQFKGSVVWNPTFCDQEKDRYQENITRLANALIHELTPVPAF